MWMLFTKTNLAGAGGVYRIVFDYSKAQIRMSVRRHENCDHLSYQGHRKNHSQHCKALCSCSITLPKNLWAKGCLDVSSKILLDIEWKCWTFSSVRDELLYTWFKPFVSSQPKRNYHLIQSQGHFIILHALYLTQYVKSAGITAKDIA